MSARMSQPSDDESTHQSETYTSLSPKPASTHPKEAQFTSSYEVEPPTPTLPARTRVRLSDTEPGIPIIQSTSSLPKSDPFPKQQPQSRDHSSVSSRASAPSFISPDSNQGYRQVIVRSFAPRVAVYASADTEEFIRHKGFKHGLCSLMKPYGERLPGKVFVRDSVGASKGFDDFGVRFINATHLQAYGTIHRTEDLNGLKDQGRSDTSGLSSQHGRSIRDGDPGTLLDQFLNHCLYAEDNTMNPDNECYPDHRTTDARPTVSPLYATYLRKLLASEDIVPHETFSHPVACMIAVSSHHPAPIEALRRLYASTVRENDNIPAWIGTEYLRYYVLIHDEEKDDITKSTALFDLMKRHFGLHCHLLRLRSSQCVETDDDSAKVPSCEWLSAEDEMQNILTGDTEDFEFHERFILESDATAIRALLREMVAQSIVPFMETRVMTWNDQVASRRRGISSRFMSLSKRWTGFGSQKVVVPGPGGNQNASGGNYDYQQGFYPPETPEASMRQLADYAFMLRDWKLAYSTYDILRIDFSHDKAWSHHAAANEMAAISSLLISSTSDSRLKYDNVDQLLDIATYSYITRCASRFGVIRCLTLAMELLRNRSTLAVDETARWGGKLLQMGVLSSIAQALTTERIADCYLSCPGVEEEAFQSTRRRQAVLWSLISADSWMRLHKPAQARFHLEEASTLFQTSHQPDLPPFPSMQAFWQRLVHGLQEADTKDGAASSEVASHAKYLRTDTTEDTEQLSKFAPQHNVAYNNSEGFLPQGTALSSPRSLDDQQNDGFE